MCEETITSICGICPGGCGVNVKLIDGKIEKILPLKGHPIGMVCVRGVHSKEIVYSNDRLKYPLVRVGKKGEGNFERISWDEALKDYVQQFPPQKVEKITRVPRKSIEELARSIAGAKGASLLMYTGLEYSNSGVQNIRAVLSLWAITDNIDVPGGLVFRPRNPARFPQIRYRKFQGTVFGRIRDKCCD